MSFRLLLPYHEDAAHRHSITSYVRRGTISAGIFLLSLLDGSWFMIGTFWLVRLLLDLLLSEGKRRGVALDSNGKGDASVTVSVFAGLVLLHIAAST